MYGYIPNCISAEVNSRYYAYCDVLLYRSNQEQITLHFLCLFFLLPFIFSVSDGWPAFFSSWLTHITSTRIYYIALLNWISWKKLILKSRMHWYSNIKSTEAETVCCWLIHLYRSWQILLDYTFKYIHNSNNNSHHHPYNSVKEVKVKWKTREFRVFGMKFIYMKCTSLAPHRLAITPPPNEPSFWDFICVLSVVCLMLLCVRMPL